ncbi:hypothetical protein SLA2020_420500 [Shorea laevis]
MGAAKKKNRPGSWKNDNKTPTWTGWPTSALMVVGELLSLNPAAKQKPVPGCGFGCGLGAHGVTFRCWVGSSGRDDASSSAVGLETADLYSWRGAPVRAREVACHTPGGGGCGMTWGGELKRGGKGLQSQERRRGGE